MKHWKFVKQLAQFGLFGIFCGAGVGLFMFLRLGMPQDAETSGYISGMFLMAGLEFGLVAGVCRLLYTGLSLRSAKNDVGNLSQPLRAGVLVAESHSPRIIPRGKRAAVPVAEPDSLEQVPVTIVMPVLNEARRIGETVGRLEWADEVIVVDGGSTDSTVGIARNAGAVVLQVRGTTIAFQRNTGIASARNTWIFALDVDERVPEALRAELASVLAAPRHSAYRVRLRNFYLGSELRYGSWGRDWHVRLFRKDSRFVETRVHEALEFVSDVGDLTFCLEHTPYEDLDHHLSKMKQYALWGAQDLHARGRRARVWDVTFVPAWRFFREYVVYGGWRDGPRGLVVAALSGCAALLKYAYLYAFSWECRTPESSAQKPFPVSNSACQSQR